MTLTSSVRTGIVAVCVRGVVGIIVSDDDGRLADRRPNDSVVGQGSNVTLVRDGFESRSGSSIRAPTLDNKLEQKLEKAMDVTRSVDPDKVGLPVKVDPEKIPELPKEVDSLAALPHAVRTLRAYLIEGLGVILLMNAGLIVVGKCLIVYSWYKPTGKSGFMGMTTDFQRIVFVLYVILACTRMFFMQRSGHTGYSFISATLLVYIIRLLVAFCLYCIRTTRDWKVLFDPAGGRFGSCPATLLTFMPGASHAIFDALSFYAFASLDPVTYQVTLHLRLVCLVYIWQFVFGESISWTQWVAIVLVCAAAGSGVANTIIVAPASFEGLQVAMVQMLVVSSGTVMAEVLLAELDLPGDLINVCFCASGCIALMIGLLVTEGSGAIYSQFVAAGAWDALLSDSWMLAAVAVLIVFGVIGDCVLKELSNVVILLSNCLITICAAVVEWIVLQKKGYTPLALESCILACVALATYNAYPLEPNPSDAMVNDGSRTQRISPQRIRRLSSSW